MTKAVIVAPFWHQVGHVGVTRLARFVRWLQADDIEIVLVRAGATDRVEEQPWGVELVIADPLKRYPESASGGALPVASARKPNKLRRQLGYLMFNPDSTVVWANRAAKHPLAVRYCSGAEFVLSSSPPESAHVAAWKLASRIDARLLIDLRDGWLDEPLRPVLRASRLRRLREGILERAILKDSSHIFVTSAVWAELLKERLPFTHTKLTVLTNCYPSSMNADGPTSHQRARGGRQLLVHTGQFSGSHLARRPDLLLAPLLEGIRGGGTHGVLMLIGKSAKDDVEAVTRFRSRFLACGWSLEMHDPIPRDKLLGVLTQADGLLLLSASPAAIPSKLFEYIPTGRPILAATTSESAVWQLCRNVPQAYLVDYRHPGNARAVVERFLAAAVERDTPAVCPQEFSETHVRSLFRATTRTCATTAGS